MIKTGITETGLQLLIDQTKFDVLSGVSTTDITLKFQFISKVYTKTMPFKDSLDEEKVKRNWIELFQLFEKDFPTGNVPVDNNNPKEDDMSAVETKAGIVSQIDALVEEVKAETLAGVQGAKYTDEDLAAAEKKGYDKAVAEDTTPISQEKYDALEALYKGDEEKLAKLLAILQPVVVTPAPEPTPAEPTPAPEAQA